MSEVGFESELMWNSTSKRNALKTNT